MARLLFGRGARGALIRDLQSALSAKGFDPGKVDGLYFGDTEAAVRRFQQADGRPVTAAVSDEEWTAITGASVPDLFSRCLQLTSAFEGHHYTKAAGNWDDAGITWGIIGFTLKHGNLQTIIRAVRDTARHRVDEAFGFHARQLLEIIEAPVERQMAFADSISAGKGHTLIDPWQKNFAVFGEFAEVQEAQRACARTAYFDPAVETAAALALTSELGVALCFDVHVQNGSVKKVVRDRVLPLPAKPERARRELIANGVADTAKPEFRENVRLRKMTFATGAGTANGIHVAAIANWGLDEVDAVVV